MIHHKDVRAGLARGVRATVTAVRHWDWRGKLQALVDRLGWIYTSALLAIAAALFYWGIWASDRYVSEAQIVVQRTDLAGGQQIDFASMLGGVIGVNPTDQLLLRAYLLSVDMLKKLDAKLDLRSHYSDSSHDLLSRMWFRDAPMEWFHRYYLSRVSVDFDDTANTLIPPSLPLEE